LLPALIWWLDLKGVEVAVLVYFNSLLK